MNKRILLAMFIVIMSGCGGGGSSSGSGIQTSGGSTTALDISGTWTGTATTIVFGITFPLSVTVIQSGSALSGSISVPGAACLSSATLTGTLQDNNITFGVVDEFGSRADYTGTINSTSGSGTWRITAGGCIGDNGTWEISR